MRSAISILHDMYILPGDNTHAFFKTFVRRFVKTLRLRVQAGDQVCPLVLSLPSFLFSFFPARVLSPVSLLLLAGISTWNFETLEFEIEL